MYYRRKIILSLLELFNGHLDKISLYKLLFLISERQDKPDYDFIPYHYGCFSYSVNADLITMVKKELLEENNSHYSSLVKSEILKTLKPKDITILQQVKKYYGSMNAHKLMLHTYINFPYYAINSIKAKDILTSDQLQKVFTARPSSHDNTLFTIGYEGISLEAYLNKLIRNDIKVLVDVRRNPLSMKFGFSKGQLQRYCENLNIVYIHIPELGIDADQRQTLHTQADYDQLFKVYRDVNLPKTIEYQSRILELLKDHKRIALTCFEANVCQCHRTPLANAIAQLPNFEYHVKHI